jgi:hypothetical protein
MQKSSLFKLARPASALLLVLSACSDAPADPTDPPPDDTQPAPVDMQPAPDGPQAVPITPPTTPGASVDCALAGGHCPAIAIAGEAPQPSLFHGYADPSLRKDPNAGTIYMAYSWANELLDPGTKQTTMNVELHLAHSADQGATWTKDGALFTSHGVTNPGGGNYAAQNQSSDEVIDLLPIDLGTSTMWIQAHQDYLVPLGGHSIYAQIDATSAISVSAIIAPAGAPPSTLLGLRTAPEARLAPGTTDPTLNPTTNLSALDGDHCTNFNQPALWYQGGKLYLVVQCFENPASGDGKATAHFVYATTPLGADATKWQWHAVGTFATPADAAHLGQAEGTPYQLLTEMQLVTGATGQLLAILNPGILTPNGVQPVTQYGCRAIPVTSLDPPALAMTAGAPTVVAKATESDLYGSPNEGTGACSYDAASTTGIVLVRKLEADPQQGFFVSLQATKLMP